MSFELGKFLKIFTSNILCNKYFFICSHQIGTSQQSNQLKNNYFFPIQISIKFSTEIILKKRYLNYFNV